MTGGPDEGWTRHSLIKIAGVAGGGEQAGRARDHGEEVGAVVRRDVTAKAALGAPE
jgi:hypothetical protein